MNRKYEIMVLLNPTLGKDELEKEISSLEKKISGKIVKKEEWGKKKLSYEIKKQKEAYYVLYYVETTPEAIDEVKKSNLINKNILRELILKHEKLWPFEMKTSKDIKFPERKKYIKKTTSEK